MLHISPNQVFNTLFLRHRRRFVYIHFLQLSFSKQNIPYIKYFSKALIKQIRVSNLINISTFKRVKFGNSDVNALIFKIVYAKGQILTTGKRRYSTKRKKNTHMCIFYPFRAFDSELNFVNKRLAFVIRGYIWY